ncbi:MAG: DNA-processing protein DprA [Clostridiales bacterium]|nr:DNA-processing protein DprA [Clostridiales bacterium]
MGNDEMTEYWIWLSRTLGAGAKINDLLSYFGSPDEMYQAGSNEWRLSGLLTAKQIENLKQFSPSESSEIYRICEKNFWHIVTPSSSYFPVELMELPDMPAALYVEGDCGVLKSRLNIAFVGTRKASSYSRKIASSLAYEISRAGAVIVSGGALGIDSAAHEGALAAGGKTVAVLGCGLGTDYLQENSALRNEIAKNGALISEFLPFTPASRTTFPIRNRIISGMSAGTVVIEAGERSGSLITANLALSQGREVFAVPGDLTSSSYTGTNNLIRDGCTPVFSAEDIVRPFKFMFPDFKLKNDGEKMPEPVKRESGKEKIIPEKRQIKNEPKAVKRTDVSLSPNAKKVYDILGETPLHIDEITEKSALTSSQVLAVMTELELKGLVALENGRKYKII